MHKVKLDKHFIKEIENQETQYWSEHYLCCRNQLSENLGIHYNIINGTVCCSISGTDTLAFNRAIGIGLNYPLSVYQLHDIINFYKTNKVSRFFIQISPAAKPENYNDILIDTGFEYYNNWVKFYKTLDKILPYPNTDLKVNELDLSETDEFEKIIKESFEFENGVEALFTQTYKRPGWKHYVAKDENKPIAGASLFICGKFASLAIAGTLPDYRGRGAQSALITKRINDATEAGCKYITVETAEDKPNKISTSNRNMKRFGFEIAYIRPNYIYYL